MPYIPGRSLQIGDTVHFFSSETLSNDGVAKVVNIEAAADPAIGNTFVNALKTAGLPGVGGANNMIQVTLDRDVAFTSLVDIADIEEVRIKSFTLRSILEPPHSCSFLV